MNGAPIVGDWLKQTSGGVSVFDPRSFSNKAFEPSVGYGNNPCCPQIHGKACVENNHRIVIEIRGVRWRSEVDVCGLSNHEVCGLLEVKNTVKSTLLTRLVLGGAVQASGHAGISH